MTTKQLTLEERITLFNEGVLRLSKKYKIGVVSKPFINQEGKIDAQAQLTDLQNESTN